jgi:hypothetical protein
MKQVGHDFAPIQTEAQTNQLHKLIIRILNNSATSQKNSKTQNMNLTNPN